ncbi:hypothetical protein VE04_03505 [Pseudogymnoascus sp. 24MN13]|nr:hypothetical protein VE04_03505 [Pseudogymnoascus sp. 24MN13]
MAPQLEIYVDGKGSVFRTAERGVVHLSISSTSIDQSQAFVNVKSTVETLTQKFRSFATKTEDGRPHPLAGITTFTVSPLNTSSYFQRDSSYREIKSKPKEFVVRSTSEVVFRNLELLSEISHELANMPYVSIVSSEWRLTGPTRMEIEREARGEAIEDAVQKAKDYAGVVGRQVVAVEIKDGPSSDSTYRPSFFGGPPAGQMQQQQMPHLQHQMAQQAAKMASHTMEGPALEPRTITVSAQVTANSVQPSLQFSSHHTSTSLPTVPFNFLFFIMPPLLGPFIDFLALQDNAPNEVIQADADRVHQAVNSELRLIEEEKQLDLYMHHGFVIVFYDSVKTYLISEWTKNRDTLVSGIGQDPEQRPYFAPVSSMYLGGGRGGRGHAYRGLEHRPQDHCLDTESYIYSAIIMQILTAWDESVRQDLTEFFDRQFADAIATWNMNRGEDVQAAAPAPAGGENRGEDA